MPDLSSSGIMIDRESLRLPAVVVTDDAYTVAVEHDNQAFLQHSYNGASVNTTLRDMESG